MILKACHRATKIHGKWIRTAGLDPEDISQATLLRALERESRGTVSLWSAKDEDVERFTMTIFRSVAQEKRRETRERAAKYAASVRLGPVRWVEGRVQAPMTRCDPSLRWAGGARDGEDQRDPLSHLEDQVRAQTGGTYLNIARSHPVVADWLSGVPVGHTARRMGVNPSNVTRARQRVIAEVARYAG